MSFRHIIVRAPEPILRQLRHRAEECGAINVALVREDADGRAQLSMLAGQAERQDVLDLLQGALPEGGDWRITLYPVETTLPFPESEQEAERQAERETVRIGGRTREEIYDDIWAQAQVDRNFFVYVVLSALVAGFGMIEGSVAVIIGAMVIAPLLGPNLAVAVGVALGDARLTARAVATNASGIGTAFALGLAVGLVHPIDGPSDELMARADVGFDGMAIAFASGAAAALSLVTGVSSALVGVMVAVALMPPTVAAGLFLGSGDVGNAASAALLLAVNMVCVNLAAQVVMLARGIGPRTFFEQQRARRAWWISAGLSAASLAALVGLLLLRAAAPF